MPSEDRLGDHEKPRITLPTPKKLEFERSHGRMWPYADLYRFGGAAGSARVVLDIGGYDGFLEHFDQELAPAVGGWPEALACVGYSAGGPFATYVGVLAGARAIAAYGAAGMKGAAGEVRRFVESARRTGDPLPEMVLFRNTDDRVDDPLDVRRWLGGLSVTVAGARPGGHAFRYYASNGCVADAFRFVLERLAPRS